MVVGPGGVQCVGFRIRVKVGGLWVPLKWAGGWAKFSPHINAWLALQAERPLDAGVHVTVGLKFDACVAERLNVVASDTGVVFWLKDGWVCAWWDGYHVFDYQSVLPVVPLVWTQSQGGRQVQLDAGVGACGTKAHVQYHASTEQPAHSLVIFRGVLLGRTIDSQGTEPRVLAACQSPLVCDVRVEGTNPCCLSQVAIVCGSQSSCALFHCTVPVTHCVLLRVLLQAAAGVMHCRTRYCLEPYCLGAVLPWAVQT